MTDLCFGEQFQACHLDPCRRNCGFQGTVLWALSYLKKRTSWEANVNLHP